MTDTTIDPAPETAPETDPAETALAAERRVTRQQGSSEVESACFGPTLADALAEDPSSLVVSPDPFLVVSPRDEPATSRAVVISQADARLLWRILDELGLSLAPGPGGSDVIQRLGRFLDVLQQIAEEGDEQEGGPQDEG